MLKEFREFALKGSVIDLAVGVILGAAVGKVVGSLVSDVLLPPIGRLLGRVDFSNLFLNLGEGSYRSLAEARAAAAPTLNYGLFLNSVLDFLIVALVVFLIVKQVNRLRAASAAPAAPSPVRECPFCCSSVPLRATRCAHCTSELLAR